MNEPEAKRRATVHVRWIVVATLAMWAVTIYGAWLLTRGDYYRTFPSPVWAWALVLAGSWTFAAFAVISDSDGGQPELQEVDLEDLRLGRGEVTRTRADPAVMQALDARWHSVLGAYGAFLTDIVEIAELPLLADPTCPATERFTALLVVTEDAHSDAVRDSSALGAYAEAVTDLERAWTAARVHAKRKGVSPFDADERQSIRRARKLLDVALDEQGYPPERREAMHRAIALLRTVVEVPDRACSSLEHRVARLGIEGRE